MPQLKARRGSTVVMVAIMLVALVGVGAIAADVGRYQVVAAELQTAADAAALRRRAGAPGTAAATPEPAWMRPSMTFVATTNSADNRA